MDIDKMDDIEFLTYLRCTVIAGLAHMAPSVSESTMKRFDETVDRMKLGKEISEALQKEWDEE